MPTENGIGAQAAETAAACSSLAAQRAALKAAAQRVRRLQAAGCEQQSSVRRVQHKANTLQQDVLDAEARVSTSPVCHFPH